jgi:hypothetical protein
MKKSRHENVKKVNLEDDSEQDDAQNSINESTQDLNGDKFALNPSENENEINTQSDLENNLEEQEEAKNSYGILLENQTKEFYNANKAKLMSLTKDLNSQQEQQSFKEIYRFSKKQTTKLENQFQKVEIPKFNFLELNSVNEMSKLSKLLESKNLRNKKIRQNTDQSDEDNSDYENDLSVRSNHKNAVKNKKIFLNEVLAKRCSSIGQKLDYKKRLLNFMYKKSSANQINSRSFYDLSILQNKIEDSDNLKTKAPSRPKTSSVSYRNNLVNMFDDSSNVLVTTIQPPVRESIPEKTHFDVSRNSSAQVYPFRVDQNRLNNQVYIFKP